MLDLATMEHHKEIMAIFHKHKQWFPHVRNDYIERTIKARNCIYDSGVVITFLRYKRNGNMKQFKVPRGDVILHQIVNGDQFNGNGGKVLEKFLDFCSPSSVWLNVRSDNEVARKFYEKHGMKLMGYATTKNGLLELAIYKKEPVL